MVYEQLPLQATTASQIDSDQWFTNNTILPPVQLLRAAPASGKSVRMAHLPCIELGVLAGQSALGDLNPQYLGDNLTNIERRIQQSWPHYPEAGIPMAAALQLEVYQQLHGPLGLAHWKLQAQWLQMAADSTSRVPGLPRIARFLAAQAEYRLIQADAFDAATHRVACVADIRRARDSIRSAAELQGYFRLATELKEYDLARELLLRSEEQSGPDPSLVRTRIDLEVTAQNPVLALKLLEPLLAANPQDAWALDRSTAARQQLGRIYEFNK
jgi:hypothetical protein